MSFGDSLKKFARDANEFVMGDHDSPSLVTRAQKANVSIRDTLDGFDYDDVQQWGLGHINAFVDSLHPDISGFLAREVTKLENMLLDSLEGHVVSVFSTTFGERKPGDLFKNKGKLEEFDQTSSDSEQERAERRDRLAAHDAKKKDRGPTTYGQTGHAFRNALVPAGQEKKAHSGLKGFKQWLDDHGKDKFEHIKDKMESRFDVIEDHVENHAEKFGNALEKVKDAAVEKLAELLGKIVKALKGVMNNIREKAIELVHFLRDVISKLLAELNRGLAEAFTTAALTCLKVFLRENTELEDIQRAATKLSTKVTTKVQHGVTKLVGGVQELFSGQGEEKEKAKPREKKADDGPSTIEGAIAAVLSGKLSQGYALVRAETREEFRTILSALETMLLAQLPDTLRSPLSRLLDGDPLSVGDQKDEKGHPLRELFSDIVENIEEIARDILMAIKNKIFAVAAGSYEVLERVAWAYTQEKTVEKMRQYLPSLKVENLDKDALQMEPPKHPVAAPTQPA